MQHRIVNATSILSKGYYANIRSNIGENNLAELEDQIANARKATVGGSDIVYDLTSGVDFSKPRKTGEALAKVIFEQDVSKWISVDGENLTVKPTGKVEIRIMNEHDRAVEKTIKDFKKDVEDDELRTHYSQQVESAADYQAGIGSYLFLGVGTTLLIQHMQRSSQKSEFLGNIMSQIMSSISVSTMQ